MEKFEFSINIEESLNFLYIIYYFLKKSCQKVNKINKIDLTHNYKKMRVLMGILNFIHKSLIKDSNK